MTVASFTPKAALILLAMSTSLLAVEANVMRQAFSVGLLIGWTNVTAAQRWDDKLDEIMTVPVMDEPLFREVIGGLKDGDIWKAIIRNESKNGGGFMYELTHANSQHTHYIFGTNHNALSHFHEIQENLEQHFKYKNIAHYFLEVADKAKFDPELITYEHQIQEEIIEKKYPHIKIGGYETFKFATELHDITMTELLKEIKFTAPIRSPTTAAKIGKIADKLLHEAWYSGNRQLLWLTLLLSYYRASSYRTEEAKEYQEKFIYERNDNWKLSFDNLLKFDGPAFMTCGTAHLYSKRGLLNYLESTQWTITKFAIGWNTDNIEIGTQKLSKKKNIEDMLKELALLIESDTPTLYGLSRLDVSSIIGTLVLIIIVVWCWYRKCCCFRINPEAIPEKDIEKGMQKKKKERRDHDDDWSKDDDDHDERSSAALP